MTPDHQQAEKQRRTTIILLSIIAVILTGEALRQTQVVTLPLALAFFITVLLHPVQRWLNLHLPKRFSWLSLVGTMSLFVAVLALGVVTIWFAVDRVAEKGPEYMTQIQSSWQNLVRWANEHHVPLREDLLKSEQSRAKIMNWVGVGLSSFLSGTALITLVFFLVLLMLLETHTWRLKSETALKDEKSETVMETVDAVSSQVRQYLLVRTIVSAISGAAAGLWLWAMKVDFPLLWGLLIFVLNYVPNIGSIIAVFPPTLMALMQFGIGRSLIVLAGLTAIEQIIGNYIDPRLQGRRLSISPIVVLLSVVLWGWIWGTVGALIAVPLTATLIIICSHIRPLRPLALLLSHSADERELDRQTHPHSAGAD